MNKLKLLGKKIAKNIFFIIGYSLVIIAISLGQHPKLSPLPALIGICLYYAINCIILHILIKNKQDNSPYLNPENDWKYKDLYLLIIFITVIAVYLYQFLKRG